MFQAAVLLATLALGCYSAPQFRDPTEYQSTAVPQDPIHVRSVLGYDKYDGRAVAETNKTIVYGNNWERFLTPNIQIRPYQ